MNLKDYCDWTGTTCAKLDTPMHDNHHMLMGMVTEIGELMDTFKKEFVYKKDIDWVNVEEEVGDIMFYIGSFCRMNNLDLEKILNKNYNKLTARYPDQFTEEKANNRNLEKERKILEQ